ncbi:MAG TPA: PKD domain-containing protein, partial [Candidatus Dormibacteraeota bacterium]|nr:PKD domain-containing protein [Candidatus Dormibacteraeota bacterium]
NGLLNPTKVMDIVHIILPHPKSYGSTYNNDFGSLMDDARNAALALGYNYTNYNLDVVVTSNQGFSYGGRSYVGDQGTHLVTPNTTLRTAGHELGHSLGLYHANFWRTDSNLPFGKDSVPGGYVADSGNAEWVEYGHYFSIMSGQTGSEMEDPAKPHYAAAEKAQLGWLSGNAVVYLNSSGTNRLYRLDHPATTGVPRGIRVEAPATDYTGLGRHYWLGYRYAPWNTATNWQRNGVQVDVVENDYGLDGTTLLDMTPFSQDSPAPFFVPGNKPASWWAIDNNDKLDGALVIGRTYSDLLAGVHITPIAVGSNGPNEEFIDVVINLGRFVSNHAPVISSLSASGLQVATNQPVSFTILATDPDGDPLAFGWDFGEPQVWTASGLNSPAAVKSWPAPGQYRVAVTVSDMKGGITSGAVLITVGGPVGTNQICGRVLWAGQPVANARVWTTNGISVYQTWTESDGTYRLANLSSTGYTIHCRCEGLTFTAQFANPINLTPGVVYGKDFYANEPLPWGRGSTFTLSGQVSYGGSGVPNVELRLAGLLTMTDFSGNFQFTNLPPGAYSVFPTKENWQFSPAAIPVTITSTDSVSNNFTRYAPYTISGRVDGVAATTNDIAPLIYLSNGGFVEGTLAGAPTNGYWQYTLSNVPPGRYDLSAFLWSYRLDPANFTNLISVIDNLADLNFIGTSAQVFGSIVGRITEQGLPLPDVPVAASIGNITMGTGLSDSDGYYSIDNLGDGTFTVVPDASGYSFSPNSLTDVYAGTSDNDFAAVGTNAPPTIASVTAMPLVVPNAASNATLTITASGLGSLIYRWDVLSANAPVGFSPNAGANAATTTASFQAPGNYVFRARATDTHGFSVASNVTLTVSPSPAAMAITPYAIQTAKGIPVPFHANAWDQLGGTLPVSPSWAVTGGGTINSAGLFSPNLPGPYSVLASATGLSASASVSVISTSQLPILVLSRQSNVSLLEFEGLPGRSYEVQYADSLANSTWLSLVTNSADEFGRFQYFDAAPVGAAARYYRAFSP